MSETKRRFDEMVKLLESEDSWDQQPITILPNGEIRKVGDFSERELKPGVKPLTFRENLGGEYASDLARVLRAASR